MDEIKIPKVLPYEYGQTGHYRKNGDLKRYIPKEENYLVDHITKGIINTQEVGEDEAFQISQASFKQLKMEKEGKVVKRRKAVKTTKHLAAFDNLKKRKSKKQDGNN